MATAVIMPRQGQSVESCVITKWHKNVGERVNVGDNLFSYETDKAAFDEEAKTEGVLLAIFFAEGDDAACLANVCVIGEQGEDYGMFNPHGKIAENVLDETDVQASTPVSVPITTESDYEERFKISPRARALAERSGVIAENAIPTGPGGRIIERDVETLIAQGGHVTPEAEDSYAPSCHITDTGASDMVTTDGVQTEALSARDDLHRDDRGIGEFEIKPLSGVRGTIAKCMHNSLLNSAQVTLHTSFDASDILKLRKQTKKVGDSLNLPVVSITDIIIFAASRALGAHNSLNAHFLDDNKLKIFKDAHIGVAVDTPRGLLVPTIFGASRMTLSEISAEGKRLYSMCGQGSINPDLLHGASFTISNLGSLGIESFTPVLNPPQTGILGVCAITERTHEKKTYPAIGLSLTFDHRALDGADAARFLKDLKIRLENFSAYAVLGGF